MPCADAGIAKETTQKYETAKQKEQHNHSDTNNSDACSPFCNCFCCGITIATIYSSEINNEIFTLGIPNYFAVTSSFLSTDPKAFWHPPQLG